MEKEKQIKVVFDNNFLSNSIFDYLEENERIDIKNRIEQKTSLICLFYENEVFLFSAVLDIEMNQIHAREVTGNFGRNYKYLDTFIKGLAKFKNVEIVSFKTKKKAVKKWGEKAGYVYVKDFDEYHKKVA